MSATAASTVTVVMPDDPDGTAIAIPFPTGVTQISIQVRAITATSGSPTVIALWS